MKSASNHTPAADGTPLDHGTALAVARGAKRSAQAAAPVPPVPQRDWPDPPAAEAYHGLFGRIVRTLEPHTEADPVALLVQLLVLFGNVVGRGPHFTVEATRHYTNQFAVLVGATSRARKGTSKDRVTALFAGLDDAWLADRVCGGLSSAEGLIHAVRDEQGDDPGEPDKRQCATEAEWSAVLKQAERSGNTLTELLRNLWDGAEVIGNKTVNPRKVTGAHVSVIAHTTAADLSRYLTGTDAANGYGNRHLFVCVKRSKFLPWGGYLAVTELADVLDDLHRAAGFAQHTGEVGIDPVARPLWEAVYPVLEADRGGLAGALTARGSAHVRRLALLYALADRSASVRPAHLLAALAVWDYAERSVAHLFGDKIGNPLADEIKLLLANAPNGLTRDEIVRAFGNHYYGDRLTKALAELQTAGQARVEVVPTGGRPAERWYACHREAGSSPLMHVARDAAGRCDQSDQSEETPTAHRVRGERGDGGPRPDEDGRAERVKRHQHQDGVPEADQAGRADPMAAAVPHAAGERRDGPTRTRVPDERRDRVAGALGGGGAQALRPRARPPVRAGGWERRRKRRTRDAESGADRNGRGRAENDRGVGSP